MDVGKIIVLAVSLSIVGAMMASTIFDKFAAGGCAGCTNHTGLMAIIAPFIPVFFGVGVLWVAGRELGVIKK